MIEKSKEEYDKMCDEARMLGDKISLYAFLLYTKQPELPETYYNGRIKGPKKEWLFVECVTEATIVIYKEKYGFIEPRIV